MYKHYYVNKDATKNPNYDHEVHTEDCPWLPSAENRIYLGFYSDCKYAVEKAKEYYLYVDGCYTCCRECHHG